MTRELWIGVLLLMSCAGNPVDPVEAGDGDTSIDSDDDDPIDTRVLEVMPSSATVLLGDTAVFSCARSGDAATCIWSMQEGGAGGTIDANGHYTPPGVTGRFHVVATQGSKTVTATVYVLAPGEVGPSGSRMTERRLGSTTAPNGFYEYLPPEYDGSVATPLLIFWHGVGENGNGSSDLRRVRAWGPPELIADDAWDNDRPFIVLSPQYTSGTDDVALGAGCPSGAVVGAFFTWAKDNYNVDAQRVYLTGLSCGAIGAWDYLASFQGSVVAGAVLLSGDPGDPTQLGSAWQRAGCSLGDVAIWAFHGDQDGSVPYAPEHDTLTNLMACSSHRDARFTDVVGGGHLIWDPIYDLSGGYGDIYAWMLANAKP